MDDFDFEPKSTDFNKIRHEHSISIPDELASALGDAGIGFEAANRPDCDVEGHHFHDSDDNITELPNGALTALTYQNGKLKVLYQDGTNEELSLNPAIGQAIASILMSSGQAGAITANAESQAEKIMADHTSKILKLVLMMKAAGMKQLTHDDEAQMIIDLTKAVIAAAPSPGLAAYTLTGLFGALDIMPVEKVYNTAKKMIEEYTKSVDEKTGPTDLEDLKRQLGL